jgi:prophage DNA circulation protein
MAIKKTPGPIAQKVRARVTRTKAEVKEKTANAVTAIKKQASGVKNAVAAMRDNRKNKVELKKAGKKDDTLGYNVADAFSAGKSKIFDSGRPSVGAGSARLRSARAKKKGPTLYKDGQAYELSRNKRKAVREIVSMRTDKGAELSTPRELRRAARKTLKEIKSKPENMDQMRKQNKRKSRRASKCIPTGKGNNLCLDQGSNNDGGF